MINTIIANLKYESDVIKKIEILIMLKEKNIGMFNVFPFLILYPFAFCIKEINNLICINVDSTNFLKAESFDNCILGLNLMDYL